MFTKLKQSSAIMWQLILTDLMVFRTALIGNMIDTAITTFFIVASMAYVMPLLGVAQNYGLFVAWGSIPSACIFELYGIAIVFVSDIRGERAIVNRFILPLPTHFVFVAKGLVFACKAFIHALVAAIVAIGLLVVGGRLSLDYFSLWKLGLTTLCLVSFVGFFTLFITSFVKDIFHLSSAWTRILYPLWYLGGAQFSWKTIATFSPVLGQVCLLNPITYLMEGVHAATLNPEDYLNVWICFGITMILTVAFGFIGIRRLKKQLNWV